MFKIWINDGKTPKPPDKVFFEISREGVLIHKKMKYWNFVAPVSGIGFLNETKPQAEFFLPPIPGDLLLSVARFFAWVRLKHCTEAGALLLYNDHEKKYRVSIPKQEVGELVLKYSLQDEKNSDEVMVGTMHSHCKAGAFHSGVDEDDEMSLNGVHVTFGNFNGCHGQKCFSLSMEASLNGTRYPLDLSSWLPGICEVPESEASEAKESNKKEKNGNRFVLEGHEPQSRYFKFLGDESVLPEGYEPPEAWQNAVTKIIDKRHRVFPKLDFDALLNRFFKGEE